jgi:hypothetical protein
VSSRATGDAPADRLLMFARRHLVSSATYSSARTVGRRSTRGLGAASTRLSPHHGRSACSHGLGDAAIAIGTMQLAAPSCCRLGLVSGHLVLLARAVDLRRSQRWSIHSSHLARVTTRSFASDSRAWAFGSSDVSNAAS